jgi:hypothetical protein
MLRLFQITKLINVVPKINLPFLLTSDRIMFSIAMSIGTRPTNSKNVVYDVGGQAIHNSKPENMESKRFFLMGY